MFIPDGFARIAPYLVVEGAEDFIRFLVAGLGGVETQRTVGDAGIIRNAIIRFGEASVMVAEALPDFPPTLAHIYFFVEDADAAVALAVAHGAELILPVDDRPYGDRQGGVRDRHGNTWWISQRLVDGPYED
ncbi:MAG TPA: VOC family protein [Candidatus Krumholzibacteria bacterium]|nr:VOC family protein [Candidatus Krumholzibacteria bacterium]HRX52604.1 VOC family protein [Candidatus Krumholzibacteria bacterium]